MVYDFGIFWAYMFVARIFEPRTFPQKTFFVAPSVAPWDGGQHQPSHGIVLEKHTSIHIH